MTSSPATSPSRIGKQLPPIPFGDLDGRIFDRHHQVEPTPEVFRAEEITEGRLILKVRESRRVDEFCKDVDSLWQLVIEYPKQFPVANRGGD